MATAQPRCRAVPARRPNFSSTNNNNNKKSDRSLLGSSPSSCIVRNGFRREMAPAFVDGRETATVYKLPTNPVKCVGSQASFWAFWAHLFLPFILRCIHSSVMYTPICAKTISIDVEQRIELVKCFLKCVDFSFAFASRVPDNNWPYPIQHQLQIVVANAITFLGAPSLSTGDMHCPTECNCTNLFACLRPVSSIVWIQI